MNQAFAIDKAFTLIGTSVAWMSVSVTLLRTLLNIMVNGLEDIDLEDNGLASDCSYEWQ